MIEARRRKIQFVNVHLPQFERAVVGGGPGLCPLEHFFADVDADDLLSRREKCNIDPRPDRQEEDSAGHIPEQGPLVIGPTALGRPCGEAVVSRGRPVPFMARGFVHQEASPRSKAFIRQVNRNAAAPAAAPNAAA